MYALFAAIIFVVLFAIFFIYWDKPNNDTFVNQNMDGNTSENNFDINVMLNKQMIDWAKEHKTNYNQNDFQDNMLSHVDPNEAIMTKTIVKDFNDIYNATIYKNGTVEFRKKIKLTPDEMKNILKLKDNMLLLCPHCCPDVTPSSPMGYLTIHETGNRFYLFGSCATSTMQSYYELDNILEKKFNENISK